jgi:hypothetical protein
VSYKVKQGKLFNELTSENIMEKIETETHTVPGPAKTKSRWDDIDMIDREIEELTRTAKTPEEQKEVEKKRDAEYQAKKQELEEKLGPLGPDSRELIEKNLADEVFDEARSQNQKLDELRLKKQELTNIIYAEDLISSLESFGVIPPQAERPKLIEVLTSHKLIDYDRGELARLLGIDENNEKLAIELTTNRELNKKFDRILRGQILSLDYRELLLKIEMELANKDDYQKSGAADLVQYDGTEINDRELADLDREEMKNIIREILKDENSTAGQGVFWNVIVSGKAPFVLKVERKMDDPKRAVYQKRSLFYYPVIRDVIGKEFFPRQVILKSENGERYFVIQEKIDLDKMAKAKSSTIDGILKGTYAPEINEALQSDENKLKLKKFVDGVDKLAHEHKLMVDVIGDNLFFSVESGKLIIRLIDYGAFEKKWSSDKRKDDIATCEEFFEKLKKLAYDLPI